MNESNALPLPYSVANSKEGMAQTLFYPQYHFVNHFKSTTTYPTNHCTILKYYQPLEADTPFFTHVKNIWKKYNFADHCY